MDDAICIRRLRALAQDERLTAQERSDLLRAIVGLQYTQVGPAPHDAVAEIFEPDRPGQPIPVANSLAEARALLAEHGGE